LEYIALILLLCGALCLLVEFFIPGFGIFGISGITLVVVSAVLTIIFVPFGTFIVLAEVAILLLLAYLAVEYFKNHGKDNRIILNETLNEDVSNEDKLKAYIGKEGVARTPLKPFGNVKIGDSYVEACSDGEFITANEKVLVVRVYENKLYVRKID
jgi:membrane-bound serine protease (ClpP class)